MELRHMEQLAKTPTVPTEKADSRAIKVTSSALAPTTQKTRNALAER